MIGLFSAVTNSRQLAEAERKLGSRALAVADAANAQSYAVPIRTLPQLSRELRQLEKDYLAFWSAWVAARNSAAGPRPVGSAAARAMRNIQAVRATCAA
jgi:hypothetical protein